jgi:hypothetical protein
MSKFRNYRSKNPPIVKKESRKPQIPITNDLGQFIDSVGGCLNSERTPNTLYQVRTSMDVTARGRTTLYSRTADFCAPDKLVLQYTDGQLMVHHNDVDGKLDARAEQTDFAEYIATQLEQKGLVVERKEGGLAMNLSKGP